MTMIVHISPINKVGKTSNGKVNQTTSGRESGRDGKKQILYCWRQEILVLWEAFTKGVYRRRGKYVEIPGVAILAC